MPKTALRLLMVEDSPADADLLVHQLRRDGFELTWQRVETASDYLAALGGAPDVILADYTLPSFGALEALGLLKQRRLDVPLIVVSGSIGEERATATIREGAVDYVLKDRPARLGQAIRAAVAARDLRRVAEQAEAARRRSETERRQAEHRFVLAFSASPIAIAIAGAADRRFRDVNARFSDLTGYARDELLGHTAGELGLWVNVAEQERAERLVAGFGSVRDLDVVFRTRAGTPIAVLLALAEIEFSDGPCLLLMAHDISDRKRAETETARLLVAAQMAREQAEAANNAKDVLLSTVSHELRTPLTPLLAFTQLLQSGKLNAADTASALASIARAGETLRRLIDDLLDISRGSAGGLTIQRAPLDLEGVVGEAVAVLQPVATARAVALVWQRGAAPATVLGDAIRLRQVVWNLVANAIKATPAGGTVTIALAHVRDAFCLTVTDTGSGIAAELLPHVFDPFKQGTDAAGERFSGLGLGLSIVRELVHAHGGAVAAASPGSGRGATFTVTLPRVADLDEATPSPLVQTPRSATSP